GTAKHAPSGLPPGAVASGLAGATADTRRRIVPNRARVRGHPIHRSSAVGAAPKSIAGSELRIRECRRRQRQLLGKKSDTRETKRWGSHLGHSGGGCGRRVQFTPELLQAL